MMKVTYSEDMRTAYFDGYKFRRDMKTGYYLATKPTYQGKRERLHVYVWRYFNGPVKEGYHVHHKDENKENNDIENLTCIFGETHAKYHILKYSVNHREEMAENLAKKARPKAAEWHKSKDGRKWHREHWKTSIGAIEPTECTCEVCGKKYFTKKPETSRFCSKNCKSAYRRMIGVDNETRKCIVCGKEFITSRYSAQRTCSRRCGHNIRSAGKYKGDGEAASL